MKKRRLLLMATLFASMCVAWRTGAKGKPVVAPDWSKAVVESTTKRYPNPADLGAWGYAKARPDAVKLAALKPGNTSQPKNPDPPDPPPPEAVKYFSSAEVHAAFEKGSPILNKDGRSYWVLAGRRDKPGQSELHEKDTDVFYVLQGSATFVTGGKMIDAKTTAPGELRGSGIEGGEVRTLSKDDVIVIPAGTPHWFKDVQGTFLYFVVKVQ